MPVHENLRLSANTVSEVGYYILSCTPASVVDYAGGDTCSDYMVRGKFQNGYNVMVIAVYVLHYFKN